MAVSVPGGTLEISNGVLNTLSGAKDSSGAPSSLIIQNIGAPIEFNTNSEHIFSGVLTFDSDLVLQQTGQLKSSAINIDIVPDEGFSVRTNAPFTFDDFASSGNHTATLSMLSDGSLQLKPDGNVVVENTDLVFDTSPLGSAPTDRYTNNTPGHIAHVNATNSDSSANLQLEADDAVVMPNRLLLTTNANAAYQKSGVIEAYSSGNTPLDLTLKSQNDIVLEATGTLAIAAAKVDFSNGAQLGAIDGDMVVFSEGGDSKVLAERQTNPDGSFVNLYAQDDTGSLLLSAETVATVQGTQIALMANTVQEHGAPVPGTGTLRVHAEKDITVQSSDGDIDVTSTSGTVNLTQTHITGNLIVDGDVQLSGMLTDISVSSTRLDVSDKVLRLAKIDSLPPNTTLEQYIDGAQISMDDAGQYALTFHAKLNSVSAPWWELSGGDLALTKGNLSFMWQLDETSESLNLIKISGSQGTGTCASFSLQ